MTSKITLSLLLTALWCSTGVVYAERADRDKPMNIAADALRYDELKQSSVFTGNVVVTKGSIVLRGAKLSVNQDAQGYQHGTVTANPGQRAFFRQKRDTAPGAPEEYIEGEGESIEYNGKTDDVKLIGRGQLRRFTGGQLSDDISGNVITYNNLSDVFSVDGSNLGASHNTTGSSDGRVRAILTPKNNSNVTQPSTGAPASVLQPSSSLTPSGSNK